MADIRRCAVYTRKSSDEGLGQAFNSLDAQREACLAYIASQRGEGWRPLSTLYDDGGFSGGNLERPALQRLMADVDAGLVDVIVVYKVDRLTRSLTDFAKIVERFDLRGISFVSITQQFNTTTSMGRLTLNVLLSFAQFEREVTGERIRDKIAASKRKGMWMGGHPPLGYDALDRMLTIAPKEAQLVRVVFEQYLKLKSIHKLKAWLDSSGHHSKQRTSEAGNSFGGVKFSRGALYALIQNPIYLGEIVHKDQTYPGTHPAIIDQTLWDQAQALLAQNRKNHTSRNFAKEPSLLAGFLFDASGNRLTPSHATKSGKRYRYYISRSLTEGLTKDSRAMRVPAHDLERLVVDAMLRFLRNGAEITKMLVPLHLTAGTARCLVNQANALAADWDRQTVLDRLAVLKQILYRVVLDSHELLIEIAHRGLVTTLIAQNKKIEVLPAALNRLDDRQTTLTDRASLKRCGSEMRLILLGEDSKDRPPRPNAALIKAVARAHVWREHLLSGRVTTTNDIAKMAGVSPRYVREILNLTYISPQLVAMILAGKQPPNLTLDELIADLPIAWSAQSQRFGLSVS